MSTRLLVVFAVITQTIIAALERDSPCTTPNGEAVTCVAARTCKVILDAIQTGDSKAIDFAKNSQCGYDTEPLVCCGSSGYATPSPLDIFTRAPEAAKPPEIAKPQVEAIILSDFNTKALPDRTVCGLEKEESRVIGGEIADVDEFPWMAALEYKNKRTGENAGIRCGGSLINNRYVLTAAHCIIDREFELISVWLGDWQISTDPDCQQLTFLECADNVQKIKIKTEIPHPFYSKKTGNNDIGMLRLDEDVKYTDYIRPICLPPSNLPLPEFGANLTVAGWGATENGTSSDIKLKVSVPLLSNLQCKEKVKSRPISANHLCAGGVQGKDSCQGDSGGPLMRVYEDKAYEQFQWYQEGVVSYGVGCGRTGYPAIYTRVSRYINWMINNIKED